MRIIGVTGGIGSGKSAVSQILSELGAVVVDADRIARTVTAKGEKALAEIAAYFGKEVITPEGELDRHKLGEAIFGDDAKREALDSITHKYIIEEMIGQVEQAKRAKAETIVLDVPIPVKHGFLDTVDEVWVVTTDLEKRVERIMKRNGLPYDEVLKRIQSQMNEKEYLQLADRIIPNQGNMDTLRETVKKIFYLG